MKSLLNALFCILCGFSLNAQVDYNANEIVAPFEGHFRTAVNLGSYTSFTQENLADLAAGNVDEGIRGAGVKALRTGMFDNYTAFAGFNEQLPVYQHFEY